MQTANEQFLYDEKYYGRTLRSLVSGAHSYLARSCGWGHARAPNPGTFGFDNLVSSIGRALTAVMVQGKDNVREPDMLIYLAAWIHIGWGENYLYWRDHKPWSDPNRAYCKPSKKLGDARRNACAMSAFENLPEDEKAKDLAIARFLMNLIEKQSRAQPSQTLLLQNNNITHSNSMGNAMGTGTLGTGGFGQVPGFLN